MVVERNGLLMVFFIFELLAKRMLQLTTNVEAPSATILKSLWRIFSRIRCARAPVVGVAAAPFVLEQGRGKELHLLSLLERKSHCVDYSSFHRVLLMKRSRF